jgi:hypothetical protein
MPVQERVHSLLDSKRFRSIGSDAAAAGFIFHTAVAMKVSFSTLEHVAADARSSQKQRVETRGLRAGGWHGLCDKHQALAVFGSARQQSRSRQR